MTDLNLSSGYHKGCGLNRLFHMFIDLPLLWFYLVVINDNENDKGMKDSKFRLHLKLVGFLWAHVREVLGFQIQPLDDCLFVYTFQLLVSQR